MALDPKEAALALHRFGFGPRSGSIAAIAADPRGAPDHGTATIALLLGGTLKGGRVIADWPGLRESALYEGRDLRPTTDLRAVLKGLLSDHLGVADRALAADVFPDSVGVRPIPGLLA